MVDYSKWNNFGDDLSDESDEDGGPRPQVSYLGGNQRVSIGPDGVSVSPSQSLSTFSESNHVRDTDKCKRCEKETATKQSFPCGCFRVCSKCAMKMATGGKCRVCRQFYTNFQAIKGLPRTPISSRTSHSSSSSLTRNGGVGEGHLWSQTSSHISIYFPIPTSTAINKDIKIICSDTTLCVYLDGNMISPNTRREINEYNNIKQIKDPNPDPDQDQDQDQNQYGKLPHHDDDGNPYMESELYSSIVYTSMEDSVDWEVVSMEIENEIGTTTTSTSTSNDRVNTKFIQVVLEKKNTLSIPNVVHWWPSAYKGQTKIDVCAISDRQSSKHSSGNNVYEMLRQAEMTFSKNNEKP
jgi:hypothetical protein